MVRELRLAAGLTQQQLAGRAGVAQPNIAAYETGQRAPSDAMVARLRAAAPPRPSQVLADHRDAILALARQHRATHVRVFGSVARGEDVSGSDLDLLVTFAPDASVFDLAELIDALVDLTGLPVDVVSDGGLRPGSNPIQRPGDRAVTGPDDQSAEERLARTLRDLQQFAGMAARLVDRGRAAYDEDEALRLAAEAILHKIGEAAGRLPDEFVTAHPEVPWRRMRAARNLVAHKDEQVDHGLIWNAFVHDLPRNAERIQHLRLELEQTGGRQ